MHKQKKSGFTLIELVIAMAIIAILATIALPSYQGVVRQSRRSEAIAILIELQLKEERWRANNKEYFSLTEDNEYSESSDYYTFTTEDVSTNEYTIKATAKEGTDQANDTACLTLSINQSGVKSPATCWK